MEAKTATLNCPNCGAAASPDSARCGYCHSTLVALVCSRCFGAVFAGMKHCPWCGEEGAATGPRTAATLSCPRCTKPMAESQAGKHRISECLMCGGLWLDEATFRRICAAAEDQEAVLAAGEGRPGAPARGPEASRTYVPCPVCGKFMNRTNFARCSGVVVDCCKAHGSWFDKDELRRILEFVRNGGLRKARERERDRLKQECSRLKEQQRQLSRASGLETSGASELNPGTEALFGALARVLADR